MRVLTEGEEEKRASVGTSEHPVYAYLLLYAFLAGLYGILATSNGNTCNRSHFREIL